MTVTITEQELIAALQEATQQAGIDPDETAMTTPELRKATGYGTKKVRRLLKQLMEQGSVESVRVFRMNMAGCFSPVTAYRFVENGNDTRPTGGAG